MKLKADLDWSLKPFISMPMLWRDNLKAQTKLEAIDLLEINTININYLIVYFV